MNLPQILGEWEAPRGIVEATRVGQLPKAFENDSTIEKEVEEKGETLHKDVVARGRKTETGCEHW